MKFLELQVNAWLSSMCWKAGGSKQKQPKERGSPQKHNKAHWSTTKHPEAHRSIGIGQLFKCLGWPFQFFGSMYVCCMFWGVVVVRGCRSHGQLSVFQQYLHYIKNVRGWIQSLRSWYGKFNDCTKKEKKKFNSSKIFSY
jgi:hypothetical protein